jgi:hypothetical protein
MLNSGGVLVSVTLSNDIVDMPHPTAKLCGVRDEGNSKSLADVLARGNILMIASK